jgi:hypothetical protein
MYGHKTITGLAAGVAGNATALAHQQSGTGRRSEPARGRSPGAHRLLAVASTLCIILGALGLAASPANAVTIGTVACESRSMRGATYNFLGQTVHWVTNSVRVCAQLTSYGWRFVAPTVNKSHQEEYLWNWVGWNGNYTSGGAGATSFTYYIRGTFKECTGTCFNSASNWVKQTASIKNPQNVNIGGAYGMDILWTASSGN